MTERPHGDSIPTEGFELPEYYGELNRDWRPVDLAESIGTLVNPASADETLYWGRNYLYSTHLETSNGVLDVAIKQFRNQGLKSRLDRRLKGSKAARSWRGSLALCQARVPTPDPVLLIESRAGDGPSFFVSRRLRGFVEARYYFRSLEAESETTDYPNIGAKILMQTLGHSIRRLHDGGIWHRDLSIGNLLLMPPLDRDEPITVYFIDLNRVRCDQRMSIGRRSRDLCRLRIFRRQHQDIFLKAYWSGRMSGYAGKRWLYRWFFYGFLFKVWLKEALRTPFRWIGNLLPRRAHAHIPDAPMNALARDRVVWDELSDQPHQHATRYQRLAVRVGDAGKHAREATATLTSVPGVWKRYRELMSDLYSEPTVWAGTGVAVRPWPEEPEALLGALDELGVRRVLLRLHPWQEDHNDELELATELHSRGFELAFSLPQNRDLVRDQSRWRSSITAIAEQFSGLGRHFQIGQAINRSKWGIWNYAEYLDLAQEASAVLRGYPEVELMGPAVIDYELNRTIGVLNIRRDGVFFDILASLLYVDRRGAPEHRQMGFDTVDKVVQLKAIAETSKACGGRSWITEFNWPLREGPHSPAGRKVSVDEETQADYLTRFYLLALGTGMAERVYWWQVVARGYGLCYGDAETGLVRRPAFHALTALHNQLEGSAFKGPLETDESVRLYSFSNPRSKALIVGWTVDGQARQATLPGPVERVLDRDGCEGVVPDGPNVTIDGSPRYFWLESD